MNLGMAVGADAYTLRDFCHDVIERSTLRHHPSDVMLFIIALMMEVNGASAAIVSTSRASLIQLVLLNDLFEFSLTSKNKYLTFCFVLKVIRLTGSAIRVSTL